MQNMKKAISSFSLLFFTFQICTASSQPLPLEWTRGADFADDSSSEDEGRSEDVRYLREDSRSSVVSDPATFLTASQGENFKEKLKQQITEFSHSEIRPFLANVKKLFSYENPHHVTVNNDDYWETNGYIKLFNIETKILPFAILATGPGGAFGCAVLTGATYTFSKLLELSQKHSLEGKLRNSIQRYDDLLKNAALLVLLDNPQYISAKEVQEHFSPLLEALQLLQENMNAIEEDPNTKGDVNTLKKLISKNDELTKHGYAILALASRAQAQERQG
jgi:hypothetical protein